MAEPPRLVGKSKPYAPGQSGNPGGRASFARAARAAGEDPKAIRAELVQFMMKVIRTQPMESATWRVTFVEACNRFFGKPREHVDVTIDTPDAVDVAKLTDAQLALLAEIGVRATEPDPDDGEHPTEH